MQLPLFQEIHEPDTAALSRCLLAPVVAIDVETETRWPGIGPKIDYGLSYPANVIVIGLAWGKQVASRQLHWQHRLTSEDMIF
jgi:hypothetical protein